MNRSLVAALLAVLLCARGASAQQDDVEKSAAQMITPAAQQAIDQALTFLANAQQEDGSMGSGSYRGNVAVSALAGVAFLSGGSTPGRGPHGQNITRSVDYILSKRISLLRLHPVVFVVSESLRVVFIVLSWRCCSKCQGVMEADRNATITTAERSITTKLMVTTISGSLCQGLCLAGGAAG